MGQGKCGRRHGELRKPIFSSRTFENLTPDEDTAMGTKSATEPPTVAASPAISKLLDRYGCGPVHFAGTRDGLYERHLLFDNVVDPASAGPRERFEAFARSARDVLSQRWVLTENTYARENPKRI